MRRLGLLGAGLLGQGIAAGNRHIGPPYYLINDTFSTDRAGGAVNGTDAEPGPGRRVVTDTSNKMSLSGGQASFASAAAGCSLSWQAMARQAGRLMIAQVTGPSGSSCWIGYNGTTSSPVTAGQVRLSGAALTIAHGEVSNVVAASFVAGTTYQFVVALRATGSMLFVKGGAWSNWALLSILAANATGTLYPIIVANDPAVFAADHIRVPATRWLPSPVLSDGFSAWGTSDGLGHAEGVAGGLGSGGSGLTYTVTGTWGAAGGVASASALSSGSAIAYAETGKADVIVKAAFTRSGGDGGLLLRFADSNNFMSCRHDGTNVVLIKKVAGSNTTVRTTATTYVAGAELTAALEGTKVRIYYNNALVGAEDTVADAALVAATKHGVYTTNTGNTFDNLVVYARGTGGEYAALDAF